MNKFTLENYLNRILTSIGRISQASIKETLDILSRTFDSNTRIWIAGNGGSAATASHLATDLSRCKNVNGEPVKAISLSDNVSLITAIANDYGFDFVFSQQLNNFAVKGDLLVIISASGNSRNLLKAMEFAKLNRIATLAITGFNGGEAKIKADVSLHVPTVNGDYGVAEDTHSILCHYLSSQFKVVQ